MKNKRGSALLLAIVIAAMFMALAVILTKIVYNGYATVELIKQREKAFWLAEAGLEAGKVRLSHNPGWYTDLPHYPADDDNWLKRSAIGEPGALPAGSFLTVREKDMSRLYSIGTCGQARVILKVEFSVPPVKTLRWIEI